jgi:PST family polysaccharide transporter
MTRSIFKNFTYLGFVQLSNYILPLLLVPFLIRKIGIEKFGLVSYAQAIIAYFLIITDYGFNLTSTREIAIVKENHLAVEKIVSDTIFAKLALAILSFVIFAGMILIIPKLHSNCIFYFGSFLAVLGQVLFPIWFFQGLQEMKIIALLNLLSKVLTVILIFCFITDESDYQYVLPIYALSSILSAFAGLAIITFKWKIKFHIPTMANVKEQLRRGSTIFVSNISVTSYSNVPILLIGSFSNQTVLGDYAIAEKLMQVARQVCGVFSQAIFPRVCELAIISKDELKKFWKSVFSFFLLLFIAGTLFVLIFADFIVLLITGTQQSEVSTLLRILIFAPLAVCINVPPYLTLLAFHQEKRILKIFLISSLTHLVLCLLLLLKYQTIGAALSIVMIEIGIAVWLHVELRKSLFTSS